jgi:hypothetical protein
MRTGANPPPPIYTPSPTFSSRSPRVESGSPSAVPPRTERETADARLGHACRSPPVRCPRTPSRRHLYTIRATPAQGGASIVIAQVHPGSTCWLRDSALSSETRCTTTGTPACCAGSRSGPREGSLVWTTILEQTEAGGSRPVSRQPSCSLWRPVAGPPTAECAGAARVRAEAAIAAIRPAPRGPVLDRVVPALPGCGLRRGGCWSPARSVGGSPGGTGLLAIASGSRCPTDEA